eukprot:gene3059-5147_t
MAPLQQSLITAALAAAAPAAAPAAAAGRLWRPTTDVGAVRRTHSESVSSMLTAAQVPRLPWLEAELNHITLRHANNGARCAAECVQLSRRANFPEFR